MLASPLTLPCGLQLPNRLAKAGMTEAMADDAGAPTEALLQLYRTFAAGGPGLMITGNVTPDLAHPIRAADSALVDTTPLGPWRALARTAQAHGGKLFAQINHAGRQTVKAINRRPLAPSEVPAIKLLGTFGRPRAATSEEISGLVVAYARAAQLAEAAGLDGVEVHGAHGYLVSQFLSPHVNLRTDDWGGTVAKRARFLLEIVREIRRRVSPRFAVAVKLNSADFQKGGQGEQETLEVVRLLDGAGIDLLEVSGGTYEQAASFGHGVSASTAAREAYFLDFARQARRETKVPLMVTGGFRSRAAMAQALEEKALDVVGLARPLALRPELPGLLLAGEDAPATMPTSWGRPKRLHAAYELGWYSAQLGRLSRGLAPDPRLSPLKSLLGMLLGDRLEHARRRRRARAGAPLLTPASRSGG